MALGIDTQHTCKDRLVFACETTKVNIEDTGHILRLQPNN